MRATRAALIGAALVLTGCGGSGSSSDPSAPITVAHAWARATVDAATTGAVYLDLTAADDDELVGATVAPDVAASVTLHQNVTEASTHDHTGMVTMSAVASVPLPAGETVALAPGGTHLMLVDLAGPLVPGTDVEITLTFATAADLTLDVEVRDDG